MYLQYIELSHSRGGLSSPLSSHVAIHTQHRLAGSPPWDEKGKKGRSTADERPHW